MNTDGATTDITAVTVFKHAALFAAAKKAGSQAALATLLRIHPTMCSDWCRMKAYPAAMRGHPKAREYAELDALCLMHVGRTLDELWPAELRDAIDRKVIPDRIEQTKTVSITMLGNETHESLTYRDTCKAEHSELSDDIQQALRELSFRERETIKDRFGLDGRRAMSLQDVAKRFGVTRARVRQIEGRALRKLRHPDRATYLEGHID